MPDIDYASLRERLLVGGVEPRKVRRTIAELRAHHEDLLQEATRRGLSPSEAREEANARLGDEATLAAQILARPELRSAERRLPWLFFVLLPALLHLPVLLFVACGSAFFLLNHLLNYRQDIVAMFASSIEIGLPILLAALTCIHAARYRSPPLWPVIGVLLLATMGCGLVADFPLPSSGQKNWVLFAVTWSDSVGYLDLAIRWLATSGLALLPYFWWSYRRRAAVF